MTYDEFVNAFNPELVGDRFIAAVDGVRHIVAEIVDGVFSMTDKGRELVQSTVKEVEDVLDGEAAVTVSTPRKRGRPAATAE